MSNISATDCTVSNPASDPAPIPITGYNIIDAVKSGFGGWGHIYSGTITPSVNFSHLDNPGATAAYSGFGSGTMADGIVGSGNQDTQYFIAPEASDGTPINPVITVALPANYTIDTLEIFGGRTGDQIAGNLESVTVTLIGPNGSVADSFVLTPFGPDNALGIPVNDRISFAGTAMEGFAASKIIISNLRSVFSTGNHRNTFVISEIVLNGVIAP